MNLPAGYSAEALFQEALHRHAAGALDEAAAAYMALLQVLPDQPEVLQRLGVVRAQQGALPQAAVLMERALAFEPASAEGCANFGSVCFHLGRLDEAVRWCGWAATLRPDLHDAHFNAGVALAALRRPEAALEAWGQALRLRPGMWDTHHQCAQALMMLKRYDPALDHVRTAIALEPAVANPYTDLANLLWLRAGALTEAEWASRCAVRLAPGQAEGWGTLAGMLLYQGRAAEAVGAYHAAQAAAPDHPRLHSNLIYARHYLGGITAAAMAAEHRNWHNRHAAALPQYTHHQHDRTPERRVRIGYLSPDFAQHPVSAFLEPLLAAHDRGQFSLHAYAAVTAPDATTARLRRLVDDWCDIAPLDDAAAAERIHHDGIDILVDLAGHTQGNRLLVLARKPAPVQVTWLGYPDTTGLNAVDYRLVDAVTDPPGSAEALHSEALLRLEGGFLCYRPVEGRPDPGPPPHRAQGWITFGSFNNLAKLSPDTLSVWTVLLRRLPEARLLLKNRSFADAGTRAAWQAHFQAAGITEERVLLWPPSESPLEHLAAYRAIDIGLDTFPYNGTTTTCEALSMGIPVITLAGDRHASRVGASLLARVGLEDLVTTSPAAYVERAVALAAASGMLAGWRAALPHRLRFSPLCDGRRFARQVEGAYRQIWQHWCMTSPSVS